MEDYGCCPYLVALLAHRGFGPLDSQGCDSPLRRGTCYLYVFARTPKPFQRFGSRSLERFERLRIAVVTGEGLERSRGVHGVIHALRGLGNGNRIEQRLPL